MTFQNLTSPTKFKEIIPPLHNDGFILYCGAGISIPSPCCAPSWWTFTKEILRAFFDRVPDDYGLPKDLILQSNILQPEHIFENFAKIFDEHLYKVFSALDVAKPNENHKLIARLAKSGVLKACFTTNFDIYIEKALREENVEFELLVDNDEYDSYFSRTQSVGSEGKFLLCKIHGTTERPDTIVSVASVYKSSKGFSPLKSQVLTRLLKRYPVLFLGYSGWDYEHANYRKFWDRVGLQLKKIYWNRRPGETGGPNFAGIFNSCKDRFEFCEADLPNGWITALQQNTPLFTLEGLETTGDGNEGIMNQITNNRVEFLTNWARGVSDAATLAAVITEGIHFSAAYQAHAAKTAKAGQVLYDPAKMEVLSQEHKEVGKKLQNPSITPDERSQVEERLWEIQIEMQTILVPEVSKIRIKTIFHENQYPGLSDDKARRAQLLSKIVNLLGRYKIEEAIPVAVDFVKCDVTTTSKQTEMMNSGMSMQDAMKFGEGEMAVNQALFGIIQPEEEKWKGFHARMLTAKEQFIKGEIDKQGFLQSLAAIAKEAVEAEHGLNVPVQENLQKLVQNVAGSESESELLERSIALFLAVTIAAAHFNMYLTQTPEFKALTGAIVSAYMGPPPKSPDPETLKKMQQEMTDKATELQQLMQAGTINGEEYKTRMLAFVQERQKRFQPPVPTQPADGSRPVIPHDLLDAYDKTIRDLFKPVFETFNKFGEGDKALRAKMLVEMAVLSLWLAGTQGGDQQTGGDYQAAWLAGKYPIASCNPTVVSYIWNKNCTWIEKGLTELPARFGQKLCEMTITLSKMGTNFDLCKRATLRSLEYTEGKVTESSALDVGVALAQWYENLNDKEKALQYFNIALDGIRTAVPPAFTDVIVYRTALLTAEKGDKEKALKIIGTFHPAFLGNLPPLKTPARAFNLQLAESIAKEMGFPDSQTAINKVLQ